MGMNALEIVSAFVDRINEHDVNGICELMADDHVFIDGLGHAITGREAMRAGWEAYFAMVPDYWIRIDRRLHEDRMVALFGKAGGTLASDGELDSENRWEIPAAWQATVGERGIAVWQVFADNEPLRQIMARFAED
jgi:ketosteroid isomerase-like protein